MKRKLFFYSICFLFFSVSAGWAQVRIDENSFPDPVFRQYVYDVIDTEKDSLLSVGEIDVVERIVLNGIQIRDLSGVELFTKLNYLDCQNTPLAHLDIRLNTALKSLYCQNTSLSALDLSGNTELVNLDCSNTLLNSLDVTSNEKLEVLYCSNTFLRTLDVSKNTRLSRLYCNSTLLTELDVRNNVDLQDLRCSESPIRQLDLTQNKSLKSLYCMGTRLLELDITQNENLTTLQCSNTHLVSIDLSKNSRLSYFSGDSWIRTLAYREDESRRVSLEEVAGFDYQRAGSWNGGKIDDGFLVFESDLVSYRYPTDYQGINNIPDSVTGYFFLGLEKIPLDKNHFPDNVFRDYIRKTFDTDADDSLNIYEYMSVKEVNLKYNTSLKSVEGLKYFPALRNLFIQATSVNFLDVSHNPALSTLQVNNTSIENLDLRSNPVLKILNCSYTPVYELDLSRNSLLSNLSCSNTSIRSLDVSHNSVLTSLSCSYTLIRHLDLDNNPLLQGLNCSYSALACLDLSGNPALKSLNCSSSVYVAEREDGSTEMRIDLRKIPGFDPGKASDWKGGYVDGDYLVFDEEMVSYRYATGYSETSGSDPLFRIYAGNRYLPLKEQFFPDDEFRTYLKKQFDKDSNDTLSVDEYLSVKSISLSYNGKLSNIQGVEYFPALGSLMLHYSSVKDIHLEKNLLLENLNVSYTSLSSLDLSKNSELVTLQCTGTKISRLDLTENTKLQKLYCSNTPISKLEVSHLSSLNTLYCSNTFISHLDLSSNPFLSSLSCEGAVHAVAMDEDRRTFDLSSIPGFDVSRSAGWQGGSVSGNQLQFNTNLVTFRYATGYEGSNDIADTLSFMIYGGSERIPIDQFHFPDLQFRLYVQNSFDKNKDNFLDVSEYLSVSLVNIRNYKAISALDGIEYFPILNTLNCSNTSVYNLITDQNILLDSLDCSSTYVKRLDLKQNSLLTRLNLSRTLIDTLELFDNPDLLSLDLSGTPLKKLVLPNSKKLQKLDVSGTWLDNLDLDLFPDLVQFNCSGTSFRNLDLSRNWSLSRLNCSRTGLTTLDLSRNSELLALDCSNTALSYLDISQNAALQELDVSGTGLSSLDLMNNPSMSSLQCVAPICLVDVKDADRTFDLSKLPGFDVSLASEWEGGTVEGSILTFHDDRVTYKYATRYPGSSKIEKELSFMLYAGMGTIPVDTIHFPDSIFRTYVSQHFDRDNDDSLSFDEYTAVQDINLRFNGRLQSLEGLKYFPSLSSLDCSNSSLEKLDVSRNTALKKLNCYYTELDSLDVSQNPVLETLNCSYTYISGLDLSSNTKLKELDCSYTALTSLDLGKNSALQSVRCESPILVLHDLEPVSEFDLRILPGFDPNRASSWVGGDVTGSVLNFRSDGVTYLYSTGYQGIDDAADTIRFFLYTGPSEIPVNAECFPDTAFCAYVGEKFDGDGNDTLSIHEYASVKELRLAKDKSFSSLKGIAFFPMLKLLDCSGTSLTSLDLSHNLLLETLLCSDIRKKVQVDEQLRIYDLNNLPDFDLSRAYDWEGGSVVGQELHFGDTSVSYWYETGYQGISKNEVLESVNFVLQPSYWSPASIETDFPQAPFSVLVNHGELYLSNVKGKLEVFDVQGRCLQSHRMAPARIQIPVQGIYLIRNQGYTLKVVCM